MGRTTIELGDVDAGRLRRAIVHVGLADAVLLQEHERVFATAGGPVRVVVVAETSTGLDAGDRAELATLLLEAVTAADDEEAWRPMVRARRLLERARIVAARGGS